LTVDPVRRRAAILARRGRTAALVICWVADESHGKESTMPIRSLYRRQDGAIERDLAVDGIERALADPTGLLWVSLEGATDDETATLLGQCFSFHPLTIADVLSVGYQAPKVDDFGTYLFILGHALRRDSETGEVDNSELDVYLGANYVVTCADEAALEAVGGVRDRLDRDERLLDRGADFLCQAILDATVTGYLPVLDSLDDEIDGLVDRLVDRPDIESARRVLQLKHSTVVLRRIIAPQREVMNVLSRDELAPIQSHHRIYFRDIYDHLVRMHDLTESLRDVITSALDIYLSVTANRTNEVMRVLTVVATIFMPLTFLAGVYGMNYRYLPELRWHFGYGLFWLECVVLALAMGWYFRRKGWL
jgi:magnesium transporter